MPPISMENTTVTKSTMTFLIEQILSYITLFFYIGTTINYALLLAMNKILQATVVKICTSRGDHYITAVVMVSLLGK